MAKAEEVTGLTPETGVADGTRLVVLARFREFRVFRDAALDGNDTEGLHDMRIACRRLSWALREFSRYIPARLFTRPRGRLRKIVSALGDVREEDAAIAQLEKLAGESSAEVPAGVQLLLAKRRRRRAQLQEALSKQLTADRLSQLEKCLSRALEHVAGSSRQHAHAARGRVAGNQCFCELGRTVIKEHLSEVEEKSAGFFLTHNQKPLHRMRKAVRELRYALESFGPYRDGPQDFFDDELDKLQTALGKLHDTDVWIREIAARLRKLDARSSDEAAHAQERDAAMWLLAHYTKSRAKHFCDALMIWNEWEARSLSERLSAYVAAGNSKESQS